MADDKPRATTEPEEVGFSSESDEEETPSLDKSSIQNGKVLHFQPAKLPWRDVHVNLEPSGETVYFLDTSEFTPNTPDIVVHTGSKNGPVAAHCVFKWGGAIKCGLGSDEAKMQWIDLERHRGTHKTFHFEWNGRKYSLSRTGDEGHGVTGFKKALVGHYKIVDDASKELVAAYIKESIGRRKGTLTIKEGVDRDLELLVLVGVAAWREKMRRKVNVGARRVF